jgi:hypothetical protein
VLSEPLRQSIAPGTEFVQFALGQKIPAKRRCVPIVALRITIGEYCFVQQKPLR